MPLFKRKPFFLVEPPNDLEPNEQVFQVRFTKEIFRDYPTYLQKLNLYRQRVWTCKVTGKTSLTYEEALVSEQRATEKVQQFPKELMEPVLHMIQFSMLKLGDLVKSICTKLQERFMEGLEVNGRKDNCVYPCKILRVLEDVEIVQYEVGWLSNDKKVTGSSIVNVDDLILKKLPFTRNVLKSFIRESTSRSFPWVVHDKLAKKHGISTETPEELREKLSTQDGCLGSNRRRKSKEASKTVSYTKNEEANKGKKLGTENSEGLTMRKKARKEIEKPEEPIRYPIEDHLVQPGADDPVFTDRPSPSRDFGVPMECVGHLLMVWDFFSSFARLLNLWPFSLEDFENAICHKDSNLILVVESHSAVLRLLMKDNGGYFMVIKGKRRKPKISVMNWTDYLCDFLEMEDIPELSTHIGTIKQGHYGLLDTQAKLGILRELVDQALATNAIREMLDKYIEQHQTLAATRRGEALEEARKRREEKELLKAHSDTKGVLQDYTLENGEQILNICENGNSIGTIGDIPDKEDRKEGNHASENSESHHVNIASREVKQQKNMKVTLEDMLVSSNMEDHRKELQRKKDKEKEAQEKKSSEKRKEHLEREMEKCFVRTHPLGKDRNYNRYWFFKRDGRIFVESCDSKLWGYYNVKEELDALMGSLNCKGERERALKKQLEKYYNRICPALQKRSRDIAQKIALEEAVVRRSTRVRAPPRDSPALAFLRYVNKWKD
ncbi:DDT domain-containing protein DDB_G0282237-like [Telopea speciosissima]|uniref:DDT domain-containing protein DDB_G0282237-like n=1 Tax=Telopea speciosissima TaxID=54955 RepID=UPI001CC4C0C2|nr:DDT domain-containing protein DDB_G0282237-like [Telopea speciosissima]XP_043709054.1 DDT domain-containing protein DDB_G0282237-like [Telopea speciosissima]XP_043709055.1 DDT domain-containing protein DDB_G0282237-like [Telopea speciosissima]